jgi:hypothetical protein
MNWIDRLDEDGWNVLIDELAWHLREGRTPTLIQKVASPTTGFEFNFELAPQSFLPVQESFLNDHWNAALEIASSFPELSSVQFLVKA